MNIQFKNLTGAFASSRRLARAVPAPASPARGIHLYPIKTRAAHVATRPSHHRASNLSLVLERSCL
jgi:hypothetical protein